MDASPESIWISYKAFSGLARINLRRDQSRLKLSFQLFFFANECFISLLKKFWLKNYLFETWLLILNYSSNLVINSQTIKLKC